MSNFHDNTAASHILEHTSNLNSNVSNYYGNEKEKTTKEQPSELLKSDVEISALTPVTNKPEEPNCIKTKDDKKQVKKSKRRKYQSSKQMKKIKIEKNGTEEEGTDKDSGDNHAVSPHVQPVSRGESFLNSSILDEILSEKKRILLESSEMTDFLKSRIRP